MSENNTHGEVASTPNAEETNTDQAKADTPSTPENKESTGEETPQKPTLDPNKEIVLIAEDSAPNRKILEHLLRKLDYEVLSFDNGKDLWETIESGEHTQKIRCVISDIMMPEMDGIQVLKKVREHEKFSQMVFLLVTAMSDKEYIIDAKKANVDGYILKPVTFKRIVKKMQELFPGKKYQNVA